MVEEVIQKGERWGERGDGRRGQMSKDIGDLRHWLNREGQVDNMYRGAKEDRYLPYVHGCWLASEFRCLDRIEEVTFLIS